MRGLAAFFGALVFCTCGLAQGGGWAAVQGIAPGTQVKVHLSRAKAVQGMLVGVSPSGMEVQTSKGLVRELDRSRITRVYLVGKAHKLRDGLIGAGAGGAGGVVLVLAAVHPLSKNGYFESDCSSRLPCNYPWTKAQDAALAGAVFSGLAAAIGAVIGSHHPKTLVYRRESAPRHQRGRAAIAPGTLGDQR
ncbi:MAG: hypothetical protein ACRD2E_12780 [Terriglobales bacterium]